MTLSIATSPKGAKELGLTRYFTGDPCRHGHICERLTSNRCCAECLQGRFMARRNADIEAARKLDRERAAQRAVRRRETTREWRQNNPAMRRANAARYRARKLSASPAWLTKGDNLAIQAFYDIAQRVSRCCNISFDVDHIEPLAGRNACGLHVPWNLRVMPRRANQVKNRRTDAEVYGHDK